MFSRSLDKFFDEIKNVISAIIFALIALAILLFVYWLFYIAKIEMPDWLNTFVWGIIDFLAQSFKGSSTYSEIIDILPVLASVFFGIVTYFANCILVLLENYHKKLNELVSMNRIRLEKTINNELHKDFLNELKRTTFMLVKIKIAVEKQSSYLTAMTDKDVDEQTLEKEIEQYILAAVKANNLKTSGIKDNSVYFLITGLENPKDFFTELVTKSTQLIKPYLAPKTKIAFYCVAELFNEVAEFDEKSRYLDKMIALKISNKIVVTPRLKIYYDNLYPSYFDFKVVGEYNLSLDPVIVKNTMVYSLQRK